MRRTKIVCTIGPASEDPAILEKLIRAGMNVARLNFSHGTHEEHARKIAAIREIAARLDCAVAILQDLAGPKIRIGNLASGPIGLKPGGLFTLTSRDVPGGPDEVSLTYKGLPRDVQPGDTLLLADGALEFLVESVIGEDIRCRVVVGGDLSSHKGINLPMRSIRAPILSDKDRADLAFGLDQGVDYVALSFVRSADDVLEAREFMRGHGREVPIIAKIEKHEAMDQIDEIVRVVDGLMVARGDLGVEIPMEQVPRCQKRLIGIANRAAKPVITATQMLKSMTDAPRPTRAEVADVANAVLDGTDAIMLSEESASGRYPVEAVLAMARIAAEIEKDFPFRQWTRKYDADETRCEQEAVAHAACQLAEEINADAVVTTTQSGSTSRLVAKYRPPYPILALTPSEETYRRLALVWGCVPLRIAPASGIDDMQRYCNECLLRSGYVKQGDTVVLTAGVPLQVSGITNLIKVDKL